MDRRRFLAAAAAAPFALAAAPAARTRSRGGGPVGLVTADLESRVCAVDLGTGRVLRHIAVPFGPQSAESVRQSVAVVGHPSEGLVTLIDGSSLSVRRVLRGFSEPRYAVEAPIGGLAYVADAGHGELATIDLVSGRVVHRTALGGAARHLSIHPSGRMLWVALGTKAARIALVDASDPLRPRLAGVVRPPFLAHDAGFTPRGGSVWVTSGDRGALAVYDPRTLRLRRRLYAHAPPQHVTFLGQLAFVTSGVDGTLRVHRVADGRLVRTARLPRGSYNVQHAHRWVLAPSLEHGTLSVLSPTGTLLRTVRAARSSHDACFVVSV